MILEALMILAIVTGALTVVGAALLWWYLRQDAATEAQELQPLQG